MKIQRPPGQTAICCLYVHFIVNLCSKHFQTDETGCKQVKMK